MQGLILPAILAILVGPGRIPALGM